MELRKAFADIRRLKPKLIFPIIAALIVIVTAALRLSSEIDEIALSLRTTVFFEDSDEEGSFSCETKFTALSDCALL